MCNNGNHNKDFKLLNKGDYVEIKQGDKTSILKRTTLEKFLEIGEYQRVEALRDKLNVSNRR